MPKSGAQQPGNKTLSASSPPSTPTSLTPSTLSGRKTWTLCMKWRRKAMLISTFHGSQWLASSFKNILQLVVRTSVIFSSFWDKQNINKQIFFFCLFILFLNLKPDSETSFLFLVNIYQVLSSYYSEIDIEKWGRPGKGLMSPTIGANLEREAPLFGATNHELKNKTGAIVRQDRTEKQWPGPAGDDDLCMSD